MKRYNTKEQHGKIFVKDAHAPGLLLRPEEICARLNAQADQIDALTAELAELRRGYSESIEARENGVKNAK